MVNTGDVEGKLMKLDSLGRRNKGWSKAGPGRGREFDCQLLGFMVSNEMKAAIKIKAKNKNISIAELVRTYIEWGLENDK